MVEFIGQDPRVAGVVGQLEKGGENGFVHVQLAVRFKTRRTFIPVAAFIGAAAEGFGFNPKPHVQPSSSWDRIVAYCSKDESRISGPYAVGLQSTHQGKRTDISMAASAILGGQRLGDVARQNPECYIKYHKGMERLHEATIEPRFHETIVIVLEGPTGCGKSSLFWSWAEPSRDRRAPLYKGRSWVASVGRDEKWCHSNGKWYDGYDPASHTVVMFDEMSGGTMSLRRLLRITDRTPLSVESKGGSKQWRPKVAFFASNDDYATWYQEAFAANVEHYRAFQRRIYAHVRWSAAGDPVLVVDNEFARESIRKDVEEFLREEEKESGKPSGPFRRAEIEEEVKRARLEFVIGRPE